MKRIIIIILLASFPFFISARELTVNSKCLEITGGITGYNKPFNGYAIALGYSILVKPRMEIEFEISAGKSTINKDIYNIPLTDLSSCFTLSHIIISSKRKALALWAELGIMVGYQILNNGSQSLPDGAILSNKSAPVFAIVPGVKLEVPISRKTALLFKTRGKIMPTGEVSLLAFETLLGVKIKI